MSDKSLVVDVALTRSGNDPDGKQLRVRLFSEWVHCSCTSGLFGVADLAWNALSEDLHSSEFHATLEHKLSSEESLHIFNSTPGIYAVFLNEGLPVAFAYVDCSSFIMEAGTLSVKRLKVLDYEADIRVTVKSPLVTLESAVKLEPVTIDIHK